MTSVCVFCGSSAGVRPEYAAAARAVGELLAAGGLTLVYGGAARGLMGVLADAALARGGRVVGVMPEGLERREWCHQGLAELLIVESLAERKRLMFERADAFLALPGGYGTLDELAEALTMSQLGLHAKPCGLLDVAGFFAPLVAFLDGAAAAGFLRPQHRALLIRDDDPARILDRLARATTSS